MHNHSHDHSHNALDNHLDNHLENHAHPHEAKASRRDFFRTLTGGTLAGASILELAYHRAAWGRAMAATSSTQLFDITNVAEGIYFARAHAQAQINSNSAIFVNDKDVLVVDSHSKPSAAAALIAQINKEVTHKPVRYVVNSHFHWDHTQGNHAYLQAGKPIDFIASEPTKKLMSELAETRLKNSLATVPHQIDVLRARASKSPSQAEKAFCADQIEQLKAYQTELQHYTLELPTITFTQSYAIRDKAHDLHLEFRGHAHTAGDVVTFCPQKKVISTGDAIHGTLPFMADGFPKAWPKTIDSIAQLSFDHVMPGHGPVQASRTPMTSMRNYIEELTEKVAAGKKAGKAVRELQASITVASLRSMQSNGYAQFLNDNRRLTSPTFGVLAPLQEGVNSNIADIYKNIDRV